MGILANENAISNGGYQIANSLRFQSASTTYMSRTPAAAGNRQTWTLSFWMKRGALSTASVFFSAGVSGSEFAFDWRGFDALDFYDQTSSVQNAGLTTNAVYRDPSSWYHIVFAWDTTQATAANRWKLYVNGQQVTSFSATQYPSQNYQGYVNNNVAHYIGIRNGSTTPFDGYLAEVNFIDGQALTPSSFGSTDPTSGQWVAAKYTGTYGTNGFYLPFSNGTSTTTLGADSSGNGNNWTLTNFTRSAGVSDCWMKDVPSGNGSPSATQPNSNYAVLNPTIANTTNLINANLTRNGAVRTNVASVICSNGKYYFETTIQDANGNGGVGVKQSTAYPLESYDTSKCATYFANGEYKIEGGAQTAGFATYTNGDVIGIAVDTTLATPKIWFSKNNAWQGTGDPTTAGYSLTAGLDYYFAILHTSGASSTTASANFGQRSFAYTPPSGYKALCTANLPAATIKKGNQYMDATTYTGNGGSLSVTNAGSFKPDLVWIKRRNTAADHVLDDSVRGAGKGLFSNLTNAENASMGGFLSFDSGGWSMNGTIAEINQNASTFVGWQWQAGQGTTSSNTNGSITSTVSVNATAGFSVVTYTGNAVNGATVGHGLGVAPKMIILKDRTTGGASYPWYTYHASLGNTVEVRLNSTNAATVNNTWNNTSPTSTVFTLGAPSGGSNASGDAYVAYCFAEIAGFSKFGSYTGNGSADGPFIYTGFQPKYILIKANAVADWVIHDATRNPYNVADKSLYANTSGAETTSEPIDILSNGFKIRTTAGNVNNNGTTYIVAAFATNPFQNSNAF